MGVYRVNKWLDEEMDGQTDGGMDGWTDGWRGRQIIKKCEVSVLTY